MARCGFEVKDENVEMQCLSKNDWTFFGSHETRTKYYNFDKTKFAFFVIVKVKNMLEVLYLTFIQAGLLV